LTAFKSKEIGKKILLFEDRKKEELDNFEDE